MIDRFENELVTVLGDEERPTQAAELIEEYVDPKTGEVGYYVHLIEDDKVDLVGPELIVGGGMGYGPGYGLGRPLGRGFGPGRFYNPEVFEPTGMRDGMPSYTGGDFARAFRERWIAPRTMQALCGTDATSDFYREHYYPGRVTEPITEREPTEIQSFLFKISDWKKPKETDKQAYKRIAAFMLKHAPQFLISEENMEKKRAYYHFQQWDPDLFLPKRYGTKPFAEDKAEGKVILARYSVPKKKLPKRRKLKKKK